MNLRNFFKFQKNSTGQVDQQTKSAIHYGKRNISEHAQEPLVHDGMACKASPSIPSVSDGRFLTKIKSFLVVLTLLMILFMASCSIEDNFLGVDGDYVSIDELTTKNIENSLNLAGQWLLNDQNENGSLKYKYVPDRDEYPAQNNMIRQFMATIALAEMHESTKDDKYREAFEKNLQYNFDNYYYEEGNLRYISYNDMAKLGSAAFALISLIYHEGTEYDVQKEALEDFILFMHNQTSGRFKTFYLPPGIDRNQNFYPGEAMLALMMLYGETNDKKYLDAVEKSFDYYSEFFRKDQNPSFVPWHTMTDYRLYKTTGEKNYADFVFEMNDFLITIQHTSCEPNKKFIGRFYDPAHEEYGPPHASSTAIYVEGLAYAYRLAKELGDMERAERYKEAILLGTRSLMQLQFKSGDEKVLGGIRKTIDNSELRIDNTQHTIMAFIQVLNFFTEEDIFDFILNNKQFLCAKS